MSQGRAQVRDVKSGHRFVGVSGAANGTLLCGLAADKVP
jgi:hypothetical protein